MSKQKIKQFDFKKSHHSSKKVEWLKKYHKQTISEEFFIKEMKKLKKFSLAKTNKSKRHHYAPSNLKREYKNLKEEFGFFK